MIFFWVLWIFCTAIFFTALYFFFDHVNATSRGPGRFFYKIALFVFGFLIFILGASIWLAYNDYKLWAKLLLTIPDLVGVGFLLWLLILATWDGPWN